ncbi:MAG TPA: hypothetical protein EYQ24_14960 [Bacteroidetes bacterium]|nr:hypothetical protein [Bacteroidota bacterium]HIL58417.1 hypothetical protein [Rhodothermales bacterium]
MRTGLLFVLLLALAPAVHAQQSRVGGPLRATDLVEWRARIVAGEAPGEARYVVEATVAEGWRLYGTQSQAGIPLAVTFGTLPEGVARQGALRESRTSDGVDEVLGLPYAYHIGSARLAQGLRVDRRATGRHRIPVQVRFAVCDDSVCLPPTTVDLAATLSVGQGSHN